jgi:hypothetical protein
MTTDEIQLLIQSLQNQIKQSQEVENEVERESFGKYKLVTYYIAST